jgi:hypothetical protein
VETQLLRAATIGTARAPAPAAEGDDPVSALLAQIQTGSDSVALAVLRMAATAATVRLAAQLPQRAEAPEVDPAPAESLPLLEPGLARELIECLNDAPPRLQIELLQRVALAGRPLPPTLLPALLDAGRRQAVLRDAIRAVCGGRGRWLARFNDDWRFAVGVGEAVDREARWLHGSLEERLDTLQQWREGDPDAAREKLVAVYPTLPAKERAVLLDALALQPRAADQDFLSRTLADRSREVVDCALSLLLRHPDSKHATRAGERLAQFVGADGSIRAPEEADADPSWKADGVELKRPKNDALGERAWWLYQLARQVRPEWWTRHWQVDPVAVLKRFKKSDWNEALLRGLHESTLASSDEPFVEALLGLLPSHLHPPLLARLPLTARERWWQARLGRPKEFSALLQEICAACAPGESIGSALADGLVRSAVEHMADPKLRYHFDLRYQLPELVSLLPLASLDPIEQLANREDPDVLGNPWWRQLARIIDLRRRFAGIEGSPAFLTPQPSALSP